MRSLAFSISLLLASTSLTSAADISAASRIDAVTVFPSGANVTREANAVLSAGDHVVLLDDLPLGVRANSLRVEGRSDAGVEIGSLDVKVMYVGADNSAPRKLIEEQIEKLGDDRRVLDGLIETADAQKRLITNLAELPMRPVKGDSSALMGGADWGNIFNVIGAKMSEAQAVIIETRLKQRALDKNIIELKKKLAETASKQERRTRLAIRVRSKGAGAANFTIKYQINRASWSPLYEARLKTDEGGGVSDLKLIRRARITQSSGENWDGVKLSLSTTRPTQGTSAPVLHPVRVVLVPKPRPSPKKTVYLESRDEAEGIADSSAAMKPQAAPAVGGILSGRRMKMRTRQARVIQAPFQAIYEIAGAQSIPSEGDSKQVQIDELDMKSELVARAVPSHQAKAYLYGKMKLEAGISVLGGRVALFRDGTFVGNGHLPLLTGGEKHELGFGADDGIRIKFSVLSKKRSETGFINTSNNDERKYKTTLNNLHKFPIKIEIMERIPVSGHEDIVIKPLNGATKPSRINIDDKSGIQAWDINLKPGKAREILFGYSLSWPKDRKIREVPGAPRPYR